MSFPGSFGSQLTAIMEALLKAVVAEVTALVEDGAVELRLELRDREQQILEKERDIEERDRVIEELRAAVEELMARREEAVSPEEEEEEDRQKQNQSCEQEQWTKDEEETKPIVKPELTEEFAGSSSDPQDSLWPPLSSTIDDFPAAAACSYDESHTYNSHETEDFSNLGHTDLPLDSFLNMNEQQGFSLVPIVKRGMKKKSMNAKQKDTDFRCDQCGKAFTEKRRLITHQSVHTGEKPYSCKKCGTRFSRADSLARHRRKAAGCSGMLKKLSICHVQTLHR